MSSEYKKNFLDAAKSIDEEAYKRLKFIFWNHAIKIKSEPKLMGLAFLETIKQDRLEKGVFLVNNGADINFQDDQGYTALMYATEVGNGELVRELLSAGANPMLTDNQNQWTAKQHAEFSGYGGIYNMISGYEENWITMINDQLSKKNPSLK